MYVCVYVCEIDYDGEEGKIEVHSGLEGNSRFLISLNIIYNVIFCYQSSPIIFYNFFSSISEMQTEDYFCDYKLTVFFFFRNDGVFFAHGEF